MEATFCLDASCPADIDGLIIHDVSYEVEVDVNIPGHEYMTDWIIYYVTKLFIQPAFKNEISQTIETELKKVFLEALNRIHI